MATFARNLGTHSPDLGHLHLFVFVVNEAILDVFGQILEVGCVWHATSAVAGGALGRISRGLLASLACWALHGHTLGGQVQVPRSSGFSENDTGLSMKKKPVR